MVLDEQQLTQHLSTLGLPDPDLIVRTGGERRLSNFLLWQSAYSEYWTTRLPWPAFGPRHLARALAAYRRRPRRFGAR